MKYIEKIELSKEYLISLEQDKSTKRFTELLLFLLDHIMTTHFRGTPIYQNEYGEELFEWFLVDSYFEDDEKILYDVNVDFTDKEYPFRLYSELIKRRIAAFWKKINQDRKGLEAEFREWKRLQRKLKLNEINKNM